MSREYRLSGFKTAAVQDTHHILGRSASMEVQMCVLTKHCGRSVEDRQVRFYS